MDSMMMNGSSSATATTTCFFKQIHEKNTSLEVTRMLWNPKMDLIALAFANADVHLYRMSWQRVWSVTANSTHPNTTVCSMAWRPDGKVLAISYSNKHLRLVAVEDAKKIYSCDCDEPIEWLYWLQESDEISQKFNTNSFYEDTSHTQLPRPISYELITQLFDKATGGGKEFADNLFIKESSKLTFLVCTWGTSISVFMHGYFLLVDTNLDSVPSYLNYKQLKSCFMSDNLSLVSSLGLTDENLLVYSLLDTRLLHDSHIQIKLVSNKFGTLLSMLDSLKSVIKEMEEQWEDILVEMDQKFQLYALEKFNNGGAVKIESSSLVNDFMLLYTFGSCSEQFKHFLLQELTEKGLRKLELSVESYYSNIQRLLNGNFQQLVLSMFYHLNELHGMTKWSDKFKVFSITEEHVTKVLNNCATLVLKSQELSFIIDQNIKEIKLFFKWLHSSMVHLNDETPNSDSVRFNQEMENSVLDFIQNTFKDAQTINMEKVGQYLKPENLKVLVMNENNWHSFLKLKFSSKENQYISLNKKEKSLIGCFDEFKKSLMECFENKAIGVKNPFSIVRQYNIHKFNTAQDSNDMIISYKCFQDYMITGLLMAKTNNECYILKHSINSEPDVKAYILNLSSHSVDFSQVYLQDVYIYGENSVTLLGTDQKSATPNTYLAQLDLQPTPIGILNDLIEVTSYSENEKTTKSESSKSGKETNLLMIKAEKLSAHSIIKSLRKFKSHGFCVSSTRKLVALLSANKHRVKIFEMEVDEDDEDDNENENNNELEEGNAGNGGAGSGDNNEYEEGNYKMSSQASSASRAGGGGSEFGMGGSVASMTSSNCATIGSAINNVSSCSTLAMPSPSSSSVSSSQQQHQQALMRGKRKKADADEDDEDDTELSSNLVEFN